MSQPAIGADPYAPPDDATVNRAIEAFARAVREVYGPRLKGIYLFGSRARGDHTPDSDADIAVVLSEDGDWDFWTEVMRLSDLSYDMLMTSGADIQGWPVSHRAWDDPGVHSNPPLVFAMHKEGRPIWISNG